MYIWNIFGDQGQTTGWASMNPEPWVKFSFVDPLGTIVTSSHQLKNNNISNYSNNLIKKINIFIWSIHNQEALSIICCNKSKNKNLITAIIKQNISFTFFQNISKIVLNILLKKKLRKICNCVKTESRVIFFRCFYL